MAGETNLSRLLTSMRPALDPDTFVFAVLPAGRPIPDAVEPLMTYREAEGLTLVLRREDAMAAGLEHAFPCRLITLEAHSSLEAVGFLAAILPALASAGMGVNPVSAFFHDHLFVPADRAEDALAILERLTRETSAVRE